MLRWLAENRPELVAQAEAELKGEYLYSDQPLKANQPVQLQQQVK